MDVLELLVDDHAEIERRFARLEAAAPQDRDELLEELVAALDAHLQVEEQVLHVETAAWCDAATVREARTVSHAAAAVLTDLMSLEPTAPGFRHRLVVLRVRFARVVADEEELFASICEQIDDDILADAGTEAERRLASARLPLRARVADDVERAFLAPSA